MSLERFDEMIDAVQCAHTKQLNPKQQEAFWHSYRFRPDFEYGRDQAGRYIIRATQDMLKQLEYYVALKFDHDDIELYMEGHVNGCICVSVSYKEKSLHLQELFQFLAKHE